jgi:hypothetical protein
LVTLRTASALGATIAENRHSRRSFIVLGRSREGALHQDKQGGEICQPHLSEKINAKVIQKSSLPSG